MADKIAEIYAKARQKGILTNGLTEDMFREQTKTDEGLRSFYDIATANGMKFHPYDEFKGRFYGTQSEEKPQSGAPSPTTLADNALNAVAEAKEPAKPVRISTDFANINLPTPIEAVRAGQDNLHNNINKAWGVQIFEKPTTDMEAAMIMAGEQKTPEDLLKTFAQAWSEHSDEGKAMLKNMEDVYNNTQNAYLQQFQQTKEYADLVSKLQKEVKAKKLTPEQAGEELSKLFVSLYSNRLEEDRQNLYFDYLKEAQTALEQSPYKKDWDKVNAHIATDQNKDLNSRIDAELEKRTQEFRQQDKNTKEGFFEKINDAYAASRGNLSAKAQRELEATKDLQAAKAFATQAEDMIASVRESKNFFADFGKSFGKTITSNDTWDLGVGQLMNSIALKNAADKADKGESLTHDEELLLEAAANYMAVSMYYSDKVGRGTKAGQATAASIPFMLEFMLTSGVGAAMTNATTRGITRFAIRMLGNGARKKGVRIGAEVAGKALSDIGYAELLTNTLSAPKIAEGTISRMNGSVKPQLNDTKDGFQYDGRTGQQGLGEALWNAHSDQFIENYSEVVFGGFDPLKEPAKAAIKSSKVLGKMAAGVESNAVTGTLIRAWNNPTAVALRKETRFGGLFEETMEEEVGGLFRLAANTDVNNAKDAGLDIDSQIDIILGLAPSVLLMSGAGATFHYSKQAHDVRKMREYLKTEEERQMFDRVMSESRSGEVGREAHDFIREIVMNNDIPNEAKRQIILQTVDKYKDVLSNDLVKQAQQIERQDRAVRRETAIRERIGHQTNESDGQVYRVSIAGNDTEDNFIKKGNIVINEDGTIDKSQSDGYFVVATTDKDGNTQIKQVPVSAITNVEGGESAEDIAQTEIEYYNTLDQAHEMFPEGSIVTIPNSNGAVSEVHYDEQGNILVDVEGGQQVKFTPQEAIDKLVPVHEETQQQPQVDGTPTLQPAPVPQEENPEPTQGEIVTFNIAGTDVPFEKVGNQYYMLDADNKRTGRPFSLQDLQEKGAEPIMEETPKGEQIDITNPQPIGTNEYGNIYQWVVGKAKEAAQFLRKHKDSYLKGVFYRDDIGDIDLVWGNDKAGLQHIVKRHILEQTDFDSINDAIEAIEKTIKNGKIDTTKSDFIVIDNGKYRVVLAKSENGNWILTAYDNSKPREEKQKNASSTTPQVLPSKEQDNLSGVGVSHQSGTQSNGKGTTNSANVQVPAPNIDTMSSAELGATTVEYMGGDRATAVAYLEAERDKADKEVKRLAKQSVKNYTDIADFKRQNDQLQAAKKAAADRYNKLQNAITAANHYQTQAEQAEQAARKAREEEKRAARRQTQTAQLANPAPAERWQAAPKAEGNAVTRTLPDGTTIRGHYVLVEAGAATPSHDPFNGWNTSDGFPVTEDGKNINDRDYRNDQDARQITTQIAQTYDGQAVTQVPVVSSEGIVYDGNGRTIAGNIAAANNTDQAYIQALADNAGNFGFTAEQVAGMQHPRVYMQTDENLPYNTTTFAKFNAQEKKSQGSTNRAVSSSKKLTEAARDGMLRILDNYGTLDAFFASETGAKDIVRSLLDNGIITQQEVAGLTESTDRGFVLSPAGKDYVTDLLIGGLFDEQTIRMLGNDKGLKQSILRAMPSVIENRRLGGYALTDNINGAIRLLYEARQAGVAYPLYIRQVDAFEGKVSDRFTPFEMLLAEEMSSGVENFRQVLNLYNNSARDDANGQTGLFEPRTIEDIKNEILQHYANRKQQPTAAAEPTARPANPQTQPPLPSTPTGARQGQDATDIPASNILEQIEAEAEPFEEIELTPENWYALFGEDGIVSTPIGYVKMGEHQYLKLAQKGRDGKLGMIKPTLEHPSVVVMDKSQAKDGQTTEREFSYVFVKAFVGQNGERLYYFTSITVSKDGQEVVVSNQEKTANRIAKLIQQGKLVWLNNSSLHPTTQVEESVPLNRSRKPTQTDNQPTVLGINPSGISADKGTNNIPNPQTSEQKSAENPQGAEQNGQTSNGNSRSDNHRRNSEGTPKDEQSKYQRLKQERRERILREGTGFDKAFGLVSPKDITSPQQITDNIEAIVKGLALAEKALGEKGNTNTNTADITHPLSNYNGWVYGEGHIANAQHQIEGYLQALDVLDPAILNEWQKQLGIKTYGDLRNYVEKIYNETKAAQTAQLEAELSKPLSLDDKKALIKQISDGKTKVVLVTNKNIVKKLAELGATRKTIADMAAALSRGEKVNGFCGKGMVILNTDALQTGNDIIATYVHERQHLLTAAHPQLLSALTDNATADELAQILRTITGTTFYDQYNNGTTHGHTALADELVSYVMQEAYATGKDAAEVAQNYGINNETILQTLNNIDYEQRQSNSLSKARRDNILGRNTQSSSRQSGRNNQTQSQGGLVQQGSRPAGKGSSGTPSRGQTPERGEIADTPVSTLSFDEQAKSLKELISFQSKEEEQYFDSILPNLKADKLGVNAVPIEVILQENSIIERLEERVSDYVSEHYPTQANISALTDSPQGKQEREAMRKDPALAQLRKEVSEQQDAAERKINDKYEEVRAITDNPSITLGQVAQLWNDALEFCRSLDAENGIRFSVEDAGENLHKSLKGSTFAGGKPRVPKAELAAAYADMFRKQAQGQFPEGNGFAYSANYFHKFNNGRIVQSVFIDGNENLIDKIQQKYGIDSSTRPTDTNVERPQGSHRPSHSDDGLSPRQRSGNERVDRLHGAEQSDGSRDNQEIDRDTQSGRATELTDPRFSVSGTQVVPLGERTLVGLHNITSDKLRKVLKAGGLANPSAAVIDIAKQDHHGYGEISLVMPSSLVDSNSGNNAGTYTGDMWSPTYPATERRMSDKGADAYYKALNSAFGNDPARRGLWNKVSLGFSNWLAGQHDPKDFAYWYMLEKGITPENVLYNSGVPASVKQRFAPIAGKRLYEYSEEDRELLLFLIAEQRGITVGELKQEAQELRQRYQETLDDPDSLIPRKRIAQEAIEDIDTYGVKYNVLEKGIDDIQNAIRYDGKIDVNATLSKAEDYVQANYKDDFDKWLIDFDKRFGIKEYIFDGYTRNGDRKYIPDTLANASRLMNREELQNAGSHGGFNATKGQLIERMNTLADIRANKYRLTSQEGEKDGQWEQLSNEWFDNIIDPLSNMQKISDNQFSNVDYAEQRLLEALRQKDPIAHLNKEYGYSIAKDSAFAKALNDLVQRIKDLPAKYFETKFKRPVYLNEFRNAVIPNNLPQDLRDGLEQAGLGLYEYDPKAEGSRREATLQATEDDGIRFSVGTTLETDNTLTPEARKEMQAIAEQAKADGTFMQAPNGKPSNLNERQWLQVRTRAFKNWFGDWNAKHEAEVELPNRLAQWLSKENIEKAQGKSRAEIIKEFGNEPQAIAYIPIQFLPLVDSNLRDNRVYSGMGYFLDHAVNHHPNIAADKYQNIQQVLNSPDEVKAIVDNGNNSIVFIKQIDRYNAVVIEVEKTDDGRIVWHKSFYDQNKKPYANKGTRLYEMSSEGGISPIIRTDEPVHDSSLSVLDDAAKIQQNNGTTKSVDNYLRPEADFSKVIDENGEPLVVYHGTNRNTRKRFFGFDTSNADIWVTPAKGYADIFADSGDGKATIYTLFANVKKPANVGYIGSILDESELQRLADNLNIPFEELTETANRVGNPDYVWQFTASKAFANLISRYGYDGIQAREAAFDTYAALSPNQIKSATSNNGSFSENSDDIRFSIVGERNTPEAQYEELDYDTDNLTDAQQLATDAVLGALDDAGISVERVSEEQAEREVEKEKSDSNVRLMLQMEQGTLGLSYHPIAGAKVAKNLETAKNNYTNLSNSTKNAISDIAKALGARNTGTSNYITIEAKNGTIFTLRLSNHNATVANFDNNGETKGISIVISRHDNKGVSNNGNAHIVEYFYPQMALVKAEGTPIADIIGALEQTMYSGEYTDPTGLAQRQEVNIPAEPLRTSNGTIYGYAKDGKIYLTDRGFNPNTPIHEYTHLWVKAMQAKNPQGWQSIVGLLKGTPMWDEVANDPHYSHLTDDNAIASEVLSRYSGSRGAQLFEQKSKEVLEQNPSISAFARVRVLLNNVREALNKFWNWVGKDLFHIDHFDSIEEVSDRILYDLTNGTDLGTDIKDGVAEMQIAPLPKKDGESIADYARRMVDYQNSFAIDQAAQKAQFEYEKHINEQHSALRKLEKGVTDFAKPIMSFQEYMVKQGAVMDIDSDTYQDIWRAGSRTQTAINKYHRECEEPLANTVKSIVNSKKLDNLGFVWQNLPYDTLKKDKDQMNGTAITPRRVIGLYLQAKDCEEALQLGLVDRGAAGFEQNVCLPNVEGYERGVPYTKIIEMVEDALGKDMVDILWKRVRAAVDYGLDYQVKRGMINEETRNKYKREFYVPQRGWEERDMSGLATDYQRAGGALYGSPYNSALKQAKGRTSLAADPFAYITSIAYSSITSADENVTRQHLLKFCLDNEELGLQSGAFRIKKFWVVREMDADGNVIGEPTISYAQPTERMYEHDKEINAKLGTIRKQLGELNRLESQWQSVVEIENINDVVREAVNKKLQSIREGKANLETEAETLNSQFCVLNSRSTDGFNLQLSEDEIGDLTKLDQDTHRTKAELNQHVIYVEHNGQKYALLFKNEQIPNALNKTYKSSLMEVPFISEAARRATRLISATLTQYNPEFAARNYIKDRQTAITTLSVEQGAKFTAKFEANLNSPLLNAAVMQYAFNDNVRDRGKVSGKYKELLNEYFEHGAQTGYSFLPDLQRVRQDFDKLLKNNNAKEFGKATINMLSVLTEASETSIRFAAYVTARESGMSADAAASLSKELTTNFDRHGEWSNSALMSLYSFMRATINGNLKYLRGFKKFPVGFSLAAAAYYAAGVLCSLLNPNDPDNDIWFTDYVRETNITLGKFLGITAKIPLGHFMVMFYAAGVNTIAGVRGNKSAGEAIFDTMQMASNELLPSWMNFMSGATYDTNTGMGFDATQFAQSAAPSVVSPFVDVWLNRNFMGGRINNEYDWNKDEKDILKYKSGTSQFYIDMANGLYEAVGGDLKVKNKLDDNTIQKLVDVSPSTTEYIVEGYSPAIAETILQTAAVIQSAAQGADITADELPFVRKFYSSYRPERAAAQQYYMLKSCSKDYSDLLKEYQKKDPNKYNSERVKGKVDLNERTQRALKRINLDSPSNADIKTLMELNREWNQIE